MYQKAFTLVELAIVLVILGLVTGGILAGQNLIRAAELKSITTELSVYQSAVDTFRDQYYALPGDIPHATDLWGTAGCPGTAGTGTQTCNGDGDGIIDGAVANQYGETFTLWQHLASAGLIDGTYTGMAGANHSSPDNVPTSGLSQGRWYVFNWNATLSGDGGAFDGLYNKNSMQFGGLLSGASGSPWVPLLSPEEAWNIDTKIDDGMPAYGAMRERFWDDCTEAANSADLDADYLLSETGEVCTPYFYGAF